MPVTVEIPTEKWSGSVREVTLGATSAEGGTRARTVTVGGETTLPFLHFEGEMPNPPAIAIEIHDRKPDGWSPLLLSVWGEVMEDPAAWAKAAEEQGIDIVQLKLNLTDAQGQENTPARAAQVVREVLQATGLPLIVRGTGQADLDNELLIAVAEEAKGERIVLGLCEDKNYRTIAAAAIAHNQLVISSTPMDVNLSKQLIILIRDVGVPLDRILMDPTTGALGYGIEYGYSVMERLRVAAFQGDAMTQQPMICFIGEETWRAKEAKVGEGVPEAWGNWEDRAITWETMTAMALIESGADIVVLRHPESVRRVRRTIEQLMAASEK